VTAGALVTLSSDDPAMFDCTLAGEYRQLVRNFGFDVGVMRRLSLNAVDASWAAPSAKKRLRRLVRDWWDDQGWAP